jgi:hypothetical protein
MKKIIVLLIICCTSNYLFSQYELIDSLNCDYNPYRYKERREAELFDLEEIRTNFISMQCDKIYTKQLIEEYNKSKDIQYLYTINSQCNCPEVVDYAKLLIDSSQNEDVRCLAIGMLGFRRQYDAIPLLFRHLEKDISPIEKIAVASTLSVLEEQTKALEIFERYCYEMEEMNNQCFFNYYYRLDKQNAIKYFEYYFYNIPNCKLRAATRLAELGQFTYSQFINLIDINDEKKANWAIFGLAAIGTTEALAFIKEQTDSKYSDIAKNADFVLNYIKMKRREKCGK